MSTKRLSAAVVGLSCALLSLSIVRAAQDRFALKAPDGIGFSEFRGYDAWQPVAPSQTDDGIKSIFANPVMIKAYRDGVPGNGKAFPEGSKIVKIEWTKKRNPASPYTVFVPDTLKSVSFIERDSKRFPDTNGWGYAQFLYDPAADRFTPFGSDSSFGRTVCHECHIRVKNQDYIFTRYAKR